MRCSLLEQDYRYEHRIWFYDGAILYEQYERLRYVNVAPYTAAINLVGDIFGVIGNAYAAKAEAQRVKYQYQMQAQQAQFQADMGRLNAEIAAYEGTRKQIAFAQNAAVTGMQAAQAMANTRVQQSHSGVRMDSTSSQQVRASQQFSRAVDMATTEQNRIELLNASQWHKPVLISLTRRRPQYLRVQLLAAHW